MQIMDGDEQNFYPSYPTRHIEPPLEPKQPVPVSRQVQAEPWRCRMCHFLCAPDSTICPACGNPRHVHIPQDESFLIVCLMIFFFLFGGFLFLLTWDDSPVRPPEVVAYQNYMDILGCMSMFALPAFFPLLRRYSGTSVTTIALVCAIILLVSMCSTRLSFDALVHWQIVATVVLTLFFLVPLIYGVGLMRRARLRRKHSGLD